MSIINWKKNYEKLVNENFKEDYIDFEKDKTKKNIDDILSMMDFDNIDDIDEVNILSWKIENIFLELFDKGSIDNLQAIKIFEYLLSKLKSDNFENIQKAYEILLIIFSVYLYENNKLENFKDDLVKYFKLDNFNEYFQYIIKYINALDKTWISARIILKYINIPISYNRDIYLLLNGKLNNEKFIEHTKERFTFSSIEKVINLMFEKELKNINVKKILFKYLNTFFSFNNYNYLFLNISIKNTSIKKNTEISLLLNSYIKIFKKYILFLKHNKEYLDNISYRSAIVLYTNLKFLLNLLSWDDSNKLGIKLFFDEFKTLFIEKYQTNLNKSFKNNDEYSSFIYYYTWEKIENWFFKENDINNVNIINLINSNKLWEDLFILANTIWVHSNIKKASKIWLLIMPISEKNKLIANQRIIDKIQYYNDKLKNIFINKMEELPLSLSIDEFLRYLQLILNIEYNKESIDLKFFIDRKFLNSKKLLEEYGININIDSLQSINKKISDYIINNDSLYLNFTLKTIYWDTDFVLRINAKNIKPGNISKIQVLNIRSVWEKLVKKILHYFNDISNFKRKLLYLNNYHKETFEHMTNMGELMYSLSNLIEDKDLKKIEQYYKNQFLLSEKEDVYKILWYIHDIGKADIAERLNRYSFINSRVDFIRKFYDALIYVFKDISKIKSNNVKSISIDDFYRNLNILKWNLNKDKKLKERIHKIIKNSEIISINESFYTKIMKEIIYFAVSRYENLSLGIWDEKIIDDKEKYDTIEMNFWKENKRNKKEIWNIEWLDMNKFLWIVLWLNKLILDKVIEKIQYPHIQECFNFVKMHNTFVSLTSSFFHHNYPDLWELKENGIIDIIKNNYKNVWLLEYHKKLENMELKDNGQYPDEIKDPIMVITTIADIIEALVISHRWYQKNKDDILTLIKNIDRLNINEGLKKIFFDNLNIETKWAFYKQYDIVLNILDNIFKNNEFYIKIKPVLKSKKFVDKVKSMKEKKLKYKSKY